MAPRAWIDKKDTAPALVTAMGLLMTALFATPAKTSNWLCGKMLRHFGGLYEAVLKTVEDRVYPATDTR